MAGNVGLLKHASIVPQSALLIEEIFQRAGFPDGAFQTLLIGSAKVEKILADERVKAATLTGSEQARIRGWRRGSAANQKGGPGVGWKRSVHRDAERKLGSCGRNRRQGAHLQ